ncbi:MAG TPA: bifunctional 5,10-methylenetetrahydrofolate dehydrogenase/5,10-methenyltetrahydrofolate cyclohydrolase [Candidatus Nitrosotenuis sp.]|jgi:methylenetetrahydrofolate dehydrogenase (NADP+)/methenyltetrahydrofolate cyclohydrolase|nr:bifunctional 5,10-methylenetetrahydrofolate dehydrogenase/5,10-methenyltetrahydrofolate cyclohydrolase [Candidatus Nitrosotenuis sp.]
MRLAAIIYKGAPIAERIHQRTRRLVESLAARGVRPSLAIVDATGDEAAALFARAKVRAGAQLGIRAQTLSLSPAGCGRELIERLRDLAEDPQVHGIIIESPLPREYQTLNPYSRVPPEKDVEGLHPYNLGRLFLGSPLFVPATAAACLEMLRFYEVPIAGRRAVVVGRSAVVGRPAALLLLAEDATVTICHSRTQNLAAHTRQADILLVAAGRPRLITASMLAPGAAVIDVGTNVGPDGQMVGDVDFEGVRLVASGVSPVRGGVGPVTTALLLWNTAEAARLQTAARGLQ